MTYQHSHWRRFTSGEWHVEDDDGNVTHPQDARAVHTYSSGDVLAHCAGDADRWEGLFGAVGEYKADRIADLPGITQSYVLERVIERENKDGDVERARIKMADDVPYGWAVVEEDIVPHLWSGTAEAELTPTAVAGEG